MANVNLTKAELGRLIDRFGKEGAAEWIETLSFGKAAKGYKYRSDYAAILSWHRRECRKQASDALKLLTPKHMNVARPELTPQFLDECAKDIERMKQGRLL